MKNFHTVFTSDHALRKFVAQTGIVDSEYILIQAISKKSKPSDIDHLQQAITKILPKSHLIGAALCIDEKPTLPNISEIRLFISVFNSTSISALPHRQDKKTKHSHSHSHSHNDDKKLIICFDTNIAEKTLHNHQALNTIYPNALIIEAYLAGIDSTDLSYVFNKHALYTSGSVGISLSNPFLDVILNGSSPPQAVGATMTISQCQNRRLYEINGMPAQQAYKKLLGHEVTNKPLLTHLTFSLCKIEIDGTLNPRTMIHFYPDGSVLLDAPLKVGDNVKFELRSNLLLSNNANFRPPDSASTDFFLYRSEKKSCTFTHPKKEAASIIDLNFSTIYYTHPRHPTSTPTPYDSFIVGIHEYEAQSDYLKNSNNHVNYSHDHSPKSFAHSTSNSTIHHIPNAYLLSNTTINAILIQLANTAAHELDKKNILLESQGSIDTLTGLTNRTMFFEKGDAIIDIAKRNKETVAFCYIDLDNFKQINDIYGHTIGDQLLKDVSMTLRNKIRKSDLLARFSGVEFAMLLSNTSLDGALTLCQSIRQNIERETYIYNENRLHITISIGISMVTLCDTGLDAACQFSDMALFQAKTEGKNTVIVFDSSMI